MTDERQPRQFGINLGAVSCPRCGKRMPVLRIPDSQHQLMWGGWTCAGCGCRMDKWGKAVEPEAEGGADTA